MDWKLYEHKVLEKFRELYPGAEVEYNAKIRGIKSNRSRQIDTLLIHEVEGVKVKTVIDSKCFNKKITITTVESFIGFLADVGADRGIMVTEKGYSKSAKARVENDESEIDLKILKTDELPDFVGFFIVMKMGPVDCWFESPPSWIVNSKHPTLDALAKIYPNYYDWNAATKNHEYMFGTILPHVNENHELPDDFDYQDVTKLINDSLFGKYRELEKIEVEYNEDLSANIHSCLMVNFSEYLVAVHFEYYTVLFGLVTPNKKSEQNLKALKFIVSQINTFFTTIPGIPNLSELFGGYNEYNWVKKDNISDENKDER